MMTKIYLFSKKIHRWLVLAVSALGLFMMVSGIFLKYPVFVMNNLKFIDLGLVRYLHNNISVVFSAALFLMMLTGLLMYFLPWLMRKKSVLSSAPPTQPTAPPQM